MFFLKRATALADFDEKDEACYALFGESTIRAAHDGIPASIRPLIRLRDAAHNYYFFGVKTKDDPASWPKKLKQFEPKLSHALSR